MNDPILFDSIPANLITIDKAGRILDANKSCACLLGLDKDSLSNKRLCDFVSATDDREALLAHIEHVVDKRNKQSCELSISCEKGSLILARLDSAPHKTQDGACVALCSIVDITALKVAEASVLERERKLQDVSAALDVGLITLDENINITFVNEAAERILGWKTDELLGKNAHLTIHARRPDGSPYPVEECAVIKALKSGDTYLNGNDVLVRKNGSLAAVSFAAAPVYGNGEIRKILVAFSDTSKSELASAKLREALKRTQEATLEKDKFLSLIAHDLKTPFTSVISFLRLIRSEGSQPLVNKHKHLFESILQNAEHAVNLIDEILQVSRFKTGSISLKTRFFDAHWAAFEVAANYAHLAAEKNITLANEVPVNTRLYADPHLFGEVLKNLVSNAIKFSRAGDIITIFSPPGDKSTIAVKDTGAGIEDCIRPGLFRHDIRTTTKGTIGERGTGLGLPYCRDIIEAHHGSIDFESFRGEGSVFYIRLPDVKPSILIVEDNITCASKMVQMIKGADVIMRTAEDGSDALKIVENDPPHLILLDMYLPEMDGFEFLSRIRKKAALKNIPVIAITAHSETENREKALKLGANDFLVKPIEADELLGHVQKQLSFSDNALL